jgi:hypothetical protein
MHTDGEEEIMRGNSERLNCGIALLLYIEWGI